MDLQTWREMRNRVEEVTLPSGLEVTLRKVELLDLVGQGDVPETLNVLVKKATSTGFDVSDVKAFMPLLNIVTRACLVQPALSEEADAEHLTLDEIPVGDRLAIFSWANQEADALGKFRPEQNGRVASAQRGERVRKKAKRDSGG